MQEEKEMMRKIRVVARTKKVGSEVSAEFEIEADASEEDTQAMAQEILFDRLIEWDFLPVE